MNYIKIFLTSLPFLLFSCSDKKKSSEPTEYKMEMAPCPTFQADSAMNYIQKQCDFGPRVTGTDAHRACGDWIAAKFQEFGCQVTEQTMELTAYDGRKLPGRNIIASYLPDCSDRVMLCAHWDCRPWADHDPDEANHRTPILAANDAASGVAVMLELARLMQEQSLPYGIDFICFDAEDWGTPQWDEANYPDVHDDWCLGSTYWAAHPHKEGYSPRFGILFDMVGGRGAQFAMESASLYYAEPIVQRLWHTAAELGYGQFFPLREGGMIMDDHIAVNQVARIPCIDIIPNVEGASSSFGPTWHTISDTPEHIDPAVLRAVGQSVLQMLHNDK